MQGPHQVSYRGADGWAEAENQGPSLHLECRSPVPPTHLACRFLDRRVLPGVNKLSWGAAKHQTDFYTRDALRCCKEVAAAVAELKAASAGVAATCGLFREALLVRVERKRLYDLPDFEQRQAAHQVRVTRGVSVCMILYSCDGDFTCWVAVGSC